MHWIERRRAVARIGEELQRQGWTLFGYTEDRSDPMIDYYAPASWNGVATHPDFPGLVACVDVTSYTVELHSGQDGWPPFQATPKGKTWHVECAGVIITTGTGLRACAEFDRSKSDPAIQRVVERILRAARSTASKPDNGSAVEATGEAGSANYRVEHDRDWTWLFFDTKPPEAVREALKQAFGARWGRKREGWYIRRRVEAEAIAQALQGAA